MSYEILIGDCIETMKEIESESIHSIVTSPPYWGLRDYGTADWEGGDEDCNHKIPSGEIDPKRSGGDAGSSHAIRFNRDSCHKCGAIRVDSQLGLEATPEEYVEKMVAVFREAKRILRPDGTLWLNLGDSYNGSGGAGGDYNKGGLKEGQPKYKGRNAETLKPKDLCGIPWRVALALQADGWYLRQDIIWHKPNPMPEPVKDRCTKTHEYLFLLTKSPKYYYDKEAIMEDGVIAAGTKAAKGSAERASIKGVNARPPEYKTYTGKRNKRSVWTVNTRPYAGAHFAVFPPELIEPCILAGTSAHGCCSKCGSAWERIISKPKLPKVDDSEIDRYGTGKAGVHRKVGQKYADWRANNPDITTGWKPTCDCNADVAPAVVFDPFGGSGTTAAVAIKHGRNAILCELNPDFAELVKGRVDSIVGYESEKVEQVKWL